MLIPIFYTLINFPSNVNFTLSLIYTNSYLSIWNNWNIKYNWSDWALKTFSFNGTGSAVGSRSGKIRFLLQSRIPPGEILTSQIPDRIKIPTVKNLFKIEIPTVENLIKIEIPTAQIPDTIEISSWANDEIYVPVIQENQNSWNKVYHFLCDSCFCDSNVYHRQLIKIWMVHLYRHQQYFTSCVHSGICWISKLQISSKSFDNQQIWRKLETIIPRFNWFR